MLPYGRQSIDDDDIQAVVETLRSDFLTTGPKVAEFEAELAKFADARFAVAVSNGTAALHCAMFAIGIGPGDEVVVPTMTFAATANCVRYRGAEPVFADSRPADLLIDPEDVAKKITKKTKAVIAVDYAGQPCDYDALRRICDDNNLFLVSDACHSIGSEYKGRKTGSFADITCFSFHPVKHITTGEGGACLTNDANFADRIRLFRNHGITTDFRQREEKGGHFYEMVELGYNYRITDIQCALGISQLKKLPAWIKRRQEIAARYDAAFADFSNVESLTCSPEVEHAYHLYVVGLAPDIDRDLVFRELRGAGIGVNVHYVPVHAHPYYQKRSSEMLKCSSAAVESSALQNSSTQVLGGERNKKMGERLCPVAEEAYKRIISLPMFPAMSDGDVDFVVETLRTVIESGK